MSADKYLRFLKEEIHSTVFATNDNNGLPHTCVIDIMLQDEKGLYFLTSTGKPFYERLINQEYVALSGMLGNDTLSTVVVSLRGKIREIGNSLVDKVFEENRYMNKIYPKLESRKILTVFQLYEGEGEYFDLRQQPPFHESFSFGGAKVTASGYTILDSCTQCGECLKSCPADCIKKGKPFRINEDYCIHCGNCYSVCPHLAIRKQ